MKNFSVPIVFHGLLKNYFMVETKCLVTTSSLYDCSKVSRIPKGCVHLDGTYREVFVRELIFVEMTGRNGIWYWCWCGHIQYATLSTETVGPNIHWASQMGTGRGRGEVTMGQNGMACISAWNN